MLDTFMKFDKLIGTKLIKVLYFLGLIGIILFGITGVLAGFGVMQYGFLKGLGAIFMAVLTTFMGIIFWRFMCEIYLLFFRLSDDVRDIKNHQLGIQANTKNVDIDL